MVRPSYVLGGRGMEVVHDAGKPETIYMASSRRCDAGPSDPDRPFPYIMRWNVRQMRSQTANTLSYRLLWSILSWQVVHSGDSACILPSKNIPAEHVETIKDYTRRDCRRNARLRIDEYAVCDRRRKSICIGGKSASFPYGSAGIQGMQHHRWYSWQPRS